MWWIYAILFAVCTPMEGTRLYPCGDAGYQDVEQNTPVTFYCDQYTGSVRWQFKNPNSENPVTISMCPDPGNSTRCAPSLNPSVFPVTFTSATNSSLTVTQTGRNQTQAFRQYLCNNTQCRLHVIVPAVVSQPTRNITRQDSGYTVSLSADITRVYSSRGLYSCDWQLGSKHLSPTPALQPPASDTGNYGNRSGSCDVTTPLPSDTGTHSCSVKVNPGNTQKSCGTITIKRPDPPTISCPNDVIAENTSLNCTCNTNNIGQPGGRLRWYTGFGNDVRTEVTSGNYDASSVSMTRRVSRDDHNRKFRCVNTWTVNIPAHNDYTAQVAWGPDTVSIQGDTTFYTDTSGSKSLTLTCQANQSNPTLTYRWNVPCDVAQQSTCTFRPRPPGPGDSGDDNRQITCTVTNVKNNNRQRHSSVTLDIKYPPSSAPQITASANTQALHPNTNLTLTCTVTGGDPVVTSVTLTCLGRHQQTPRAGQSNSLEISPVTTADHNLTCVCRGHWVRESYYTLTNFTTLIVYYSPTNTTLVVNNNVNVTVNENEAVTLVCQSRGVPAPRLELLQRDVQLARQDGDSLPEFRSRLSYTTTARCDHTGTVTCRADNGVGHGQETSVQLYVNCKPRSSSTAEPEPRMVNFIKDPVTVPFRLEAFPLPHIFSFRYLGSSQSSSNSQPVTDTIELSATCTNTFADYAVVCKVTVHSVKNSSAEGFYTFTAANAFGEEQMVFQVSKNASAEESKMDFVALGAGLGTGLAVLVIGVIICVCCVCRRKRKRDQSHGRNEGSQPSGTPVGQDIPDPPNSPYEDFQMDPVANPPVTSEPQPVTEPQPGTSAAPEDHVYAPVIPRSQRPRPTQAAAAADDKASNVYDVMDRSGRTPAVSASAEPAPSGPHTPQPGADGADDLYSHLDRNRRTPAVSASAEPTPSEPHTPQPGGPVVVPINRPEPAGEESVYENQAFVGDSTSPPAPSEASSGRTVNPDGLVYTTVHFSDSQRQKEKYLPSRDKTDYTAVFFDPKAKAAKKKKK